jgi:hypothetical protein
MRIQPWTELGGRSITSEQNWTIVVQHVPISPFFFIHLRYCRIDDLTVDWQYKNGSGRISRFAIGYQPCEWLGVPTNPRLKRMSQQNIPKRPFLQCLKRASGFIPAMESKKGNGTPDLSRKKYREFIYSDVLTLGSNETRLWQNSSISFMAEVRKNFIIKHQHNKHVF